MFTVKDLFLTKIEEVATALKYDFLYEDVYDEFICQIVKRDMYGDILGTPLTLKLDIDETKGCGEVIYYNSQGEFKRQSFTLDNPETISGIVIFIHERLSTNLYKK